MKDTEKIALMLIDEEDGRKPKKKSFLEKLKEPAIIENNLQEETGHVTEISDRQLRKVVFFIILSLIISFVIGYFIGKS